MSKNKQKTNKAIQKRIKITSGGKLMRRHQLSGGHLKRNKSKGALERAKNPLMFFKSDEKKYKRLIGRQYALMGKQTKNFRQSQKSISGSKGASIFAKQNRGQWHTKIINYFKFSKKGKNYQVVVDNLAEIAK